MYISQQRTYTCSVSTCTELNTPRLPLSSDGHTGQQAVSRPSSRRKHKRKAREDAMRLQKEYPCNELFPSSPSNMQDPQQLNVAYWNTNGHLTGGSVHTVCELITHLNVDVCVLIDTRLRQRAATPRALASRCDSRNNAAQRGARIYIAPTMVCMRWPPACLT